MRALLKELMRTLIERAGKIGYTKIRFAVKQGEAVAGFYGKFGARRFGELPDEQYGLILYYMTYRVKDK